MIKFIYLICYNIIKYTSSFLEDTYKCTLQKNLCTSIKVCIYIFNTYITIYVHIHLYFSSVFYVKKQSYSYCLMLKLLANKQSYQSD